MAGMSLGMPSFGGTTYGPQQPNFSIGGMSRTPIKPSASSVSNYQPNYNTVSNKAPTDGSAYVQDKFGQYHYNTTKPASTAALAPAAGAGGGSGYAGGSGPTNMGALPPQVAVPVNEGKIPEVPEATATGSAPGGGGGPAAGWNVVARGGLNDRLGTRIPRMSMNALSAGIY